MRVGVDYYPEHWPEDRWPVDARLMREAGLTIVRVAEFAWCKMEPQEGQYDFAWLLRAMDVLHAEGISVVLGTPTATPPAWLHERYPDIYPVDSRRYPLGFGTRLQRCLGHPTMRDYSRRITEQMVSATHAHPAVIGWQTDNEFEANLCYCDGCAERFRAWLRTKYGTLDALNAAWGAIFWSQEYSAWSQIPLPWVVRCGEAHNPSLKLDYRRFASETTVAFQKEQVDIIRRLAPGQFVTHNLMGLHETMDYVDLARDLDFVAWDNYPGGDWNADWDPALAHDVTRGLKQRSFWVMEEQSGIAGWESIGTRPWPGQVRAWAWQSIAHGADAVIFFRWRSCLYGTEQYWHGVLNHDGVPRRRYKEVRQFASEVADLAPLLDGTAVAADVAILNSYEQNWAFQIQPQREGLAWYDQVRRYHKALSRQGLGVDVVPLEADLSGYRLVMAPSWYLLSENDARRLISYAEAGGILVLSPRTGVKNQVNVCRPQPLPSLLAAAAGVEVDDYCPLGKETQTVRFAGAVYTVSVWADILKLTGAEGIAEYVEGQFPGEPAAASVACGSGRIVTLGVYGNDGFYDALLGQLLTGVGLLGVQGIPAGVDVCRRVIGDRRILLLTNLTREPQTMPAPAGLETLMGPCPVDGAIELPSLGVGVYRET